MTRPRRAFALALLCATATSQCPSFDFESDYIGACPSGWLCRGSAGVRDWREMPAGCELTGGAGGNHVFKVGCDQFFHGVASSAPFILPVGVAALRYKRSGGADAGSGVWVRDADTGEIIGSSDRGDETQVMFAVSISLVGGGGRRVYIELRETHASAIKGVVVDDLRLTGAFGGTLEPLNCTDITPDPELGQCSMEWCTSPSIIDSGHDCYAGTSEEKCSCSQGEARLTGHEVWYRKKKLYEYTCCTGDDGNVGESCGDCCSEWSAALMVVGVIIGLVCLSGCCVGAGLLCCRRSGACCFAGVRTSTRQPAGVVQDHPLGFEYTGGRRASASAQSASYRDPPPRNGYATSGTQMQPPIAQGVPVSAHGGGYMPGPAVAVAVPVHTSSTSSTPVVATPVAMSHA